jgi:hypothetical protein
VSETIHSSSSSATTILATTGKSITNSTAAVLGAYEAHLQSIKTENLDAIVSGYESNATINVTGAGGPMGINGKYTGASSIRSLYNQLLFQVNTTVNLANTSYVASTQGRGATVLSNFTIYGNADGLVLVLEAGCSSCVYVSNISEHIMLAGGEGRWLISAETLDIHTFNICGSMSDTKCSTLLSDPQFSSSSSG